ncbi:polysaccharide deacetylase family protein [Planococcus halotolerans]|uniref:Polysaccharide deacetylase family protein n=1 Tax=Planococcus halotolerans TaxID=2233542 RepID=A0A365L1U6_9BACL|nr:polysaccharide deacetylase family protein [Planococcus halotolerans]QHJ70835.1 polysaccharide deacetylase family protein [Planococcus halotolerans]RAZ79408.1 polysaccharide deacetylase family protein [Planococcus halotolerans]
MIHAKWMLMAAGLALLTACSSGEDNPAATDTNNETEETTSETTSETKEESSKDSAEEDAEAEVTEEEDAEETAAEEEPAQAEPLYRVNPANSAVEPIAGANPQAVLITIDDAPDKQGVAMAETLKELNVPAIFFVNGHFIDTEEEEENLKKIHDMGFAIGNHTYSHPNLKTIPEDQQREEIVSLNDRIEEIIGERPEFFRAPHGVNTDFSRALVEEEGMVLMNWTFGYDWEKQYMDATALADIMVNTEFMRDGANLLMHDRVWTAEALPAIVQGLEDKGYEFIDPDTIEGVE